MKRLSTAELARRLGYVMHDAAKSPITLTRHDKARFVVITVEYYERLRKAGLENGASDIKFPEMPKS